VRVTIEQPEAIREFAYAQGWLPRGVEVTHLENVDPSDSVQIYLRGHLSNATTLIFKQADEDDVTDESFMAMIDAANALTHKEDEQPVLLGYAEKERILCMRDIGQDAPS
jgi:hypothetical protein